MAAEHRLRWLLLCALLWAGAAALHAPPRVIARRTPALAAARCGLRLCAPPPPSSTADPALGVPSAPPSPAWTEQLQLFWRLAVPYFKQEDGAKLGFVLLLGLTLLNSGVSVLFSYTSRDFWTALSSKDSEQFYMLTLRFAGALALATPVSVLYKYQRGRVAVSWREWMTLRLTDMYYDNEAYYRLELGGGSAPPNTAEGAAAAAGAGEQADSSPSAAAPSFSLVAASSLAVDNPDQRLAEDARAFTRVSLDFGITLLTSAIDLVSFSTILWSIYPDLFYAIIGYAGFGSLTTIYLGRPLVALNAQQLLREADFRYALVRVRENAESIAFYRGQEQEGAEVQSRLGRLINNTRTLLASQRNLEFFITGYRYLVQILPILVVAPLYFAGRVELGVISQSSGAFNHVLSDFSILINEFEALSSFSAGLSRLSTFVARLESYELEDSASQLRSGSPPSPLNMTFNLTQLSVPTLFSEAADAAARAAATDGLISAAARGLPSGEGGVAGGWGGVSTGGSGGGTEGGVGSGAISVAPLFGAVVPMAALAESRIRLVEKIPGGEGAPVLAASGLRLLTPDGRRELFREVDFAIAQGEHLLILGPSGSGKSSLLRAIAGLWRTGEGSIERPPHSHILFLPQRPYCPIGSLRLQLHYPRVPPPPSQEEDKRIVQALRTVRLESLEHRLSAEEGSISGALDAVRDWSDMLSLGEQQRLTFARVLVSQPTLAILDEATSALDLDNEAAMYGALSRMPGLTFVSVGHRPSLQQYHTTQLKLTPTGASAKPAERTAAAVVAA